MQKEHGCCAGCRVERCLVCCCSRLVVADPRQFLSIQPCHYEIRKLSRCDLAQGIRFLWKPMWCAIPDALLSCSIPLVHPFRSTSASCCRNITSLNWLQTLCCVGPKKPIFYETFIQQAYVPPNVKWSVIDTGNTGEIVDDALPTQNQFVNFS